MADLTLDAITAAAANERGALAATLLAAEARRGGEVWGPLCGEPCAAGMEAIYEGYLLHYGQSAPVRAARRRRAPALRRPPLRPGTGLDRRDR